MKKLIFLTISFFALTNMYSQQPRTLNATNFNPNVDSVAESLVLLAMNNPQIKFSEKQALAQRYVYTRSKTLWLNTITLTGNLNEYSIQEFNNSNIYNGNTLYPRYNFGIQLPLGIFVNNGKQTKSELYRYQAATEDIETIKLNIRKAVLLAYEDYQTDKELLAFQQQVVLDSRLFYSKTEARYQKGEINLEDYILAGRSKNTEEVRLLNTRRDIANAETNIEALIGMRLDDALQMINSRK
ncbi:MAG TPA: TolC family protein [Puia sp.]|nr:TolC family protein [Puia sp.]